MEFVDSLVNSAKLKAFFGVLSTVVLSIIGQEYLAYEVLFVLVFIDTIVGSLRGIKEKCVSSKKFFRTGHKLLLYFLLILASHQLTRYTELLIWLEHFVVIFLAITEMISIIENLHYLGIPIPEWVVEKLEMYLQKPE